MGYNAFALPISFTVGGQPMTLHKSRKGGEALMSVFETLIVIFAFAEFMLKVLEYIDKRK